MSVPNFSQQEKGWLEAYLSYDFPEREKIIQQIRSSIITREYTKWYLSMKFNPDKSLSPALKTKRVPVLMLAHVENRAPLEFLLHIIDGYVTELEILFADSTEINANIDIAGVKLEYVLDGCESVVRDGV